MSLIVIEGLDGSGKATQTARLAEYLIGRGDSVKAITFPNYESESSALIKLYLSGELGGLDEVNVYAVSSFYAADRYISYQTGWKKEYRAGHTILADRYTTSNAVYQMARLPRDRWEDYLAWLWDYEFVRIGLPKPDTVLYLDLSPEIAGELVRGRYGGDDSRRDLHEADTAYQLTCREAALTAAEKLGWRVISCEEGGAALPVEKVFEKILAELFTGGIQ